MKRKVMDYLQNRNFKVVRVTKDEFELENGDIYPIQFKLDFEPTIEEFQKFLDDSKDLVKELIKKHG